MENEVTPEFFLLYCVLDKQIPIRMSTPLSPGSQKYEKAASPNEIYGATFARYPDYKKYNVYIINIIDDNRRKMVTYDKQ
jgi:hypothetical protein